MSGYYETPDPDERESDNSGGGLRKQLEQALKEIKDLRAELKGEKRQETVTGLLEGMGLDPAVAELIPADEADPKKWLNDRAHLFGVKKAEAEETQPGTEPEIHVAPDDDPAVAAERAALEAMNGAAASGSPQATVTNDLIEQMNKIETEDALVAFFKSNGMA